MSAHACTDLQEILPSMKDEEYVTTPACTQVKNKSILIKGYNFDTESVRDSSEKVTQLTWLPSAEFVRELGFQVSTTSTVVVPAITLQPNTSALNYCMCVCALGRKG